MNDKNDKNIEVDVVQNLAELMQVFEIRRQEFVEKQNIPEEAEFDGGNDFSGTQLLAKVDGKPAGTLRIRYFKDFVRFERMCVVPEFRKTDVVKNILQFAGKLLRSKGFEKAHCFCTADVLPHWLSNNHKLIKDAKPLVTHGSTLYSIEYEFGSNENYIKVNDDPQILIANESKLENYVSKKTEQQIKDKEIARITALILQYKKNAVYK